MDGDSFLIEEQSVSTDIRLTVGIKPQGEESNPLSGSEDESTAVYYYDSSEAPTNLPRLHDALHHELEERHPTADSVVIINREKVAPEGPNA
jgi:hypothetical protein